MADEPMRALTLRQPWAGCVAHLGKRTENRSRRLPGKYAGVPVAIHAGATVAHGRKLPADVEKAVRDQLAEVGDVPR